MSSHHKSRLPVRTLLLALMVIPPGLVLFGIPWLKQQPDTVIFLLSGLAAVVTIIASFVLALLHDRNIDEWERSNAGFSSQWGWTAGASLVALLLALPPFRDFIVSAAANLADAPNPDHKLVVLAFTFGFGAVVVAQCVITALLSIGWAMWKSRPARDAS
jgi:hypothetical protein